MSAVAIRRVGIDDELAAAFAREYVDATRRPVCVVIAAFNEERGIGDVVSRIPDEVCGLRTETVVVVDGSDDATATVARRAGALVCEVGVNRGQGAALRLGYRLARDGRARFIASLDADGQQDPAALPSLIGPLLAGECDFVTGSRRLGAAHTTDRVRSAGVLVFAALISVLGRCRITDPANGLRAMTVEVSAVVPLEQPQYQAAELLLGALLAGFRVIEVPTVVFRRAEGCTKKGGNLRYGLQFARVIATTWWRDRHGTRRP